MRFVKKIKLYIRYYFIIFIGLIKYDFQKNQLLVFNYHNFNHSENVTNEMFVNYNNFKNQILYFQQRKILTSINVFENNKNNNTKKILLTIDDADISLEKLLPIIKQEDINIILFLPIGFVLDKSDINYYRSICLHHYFFINKGKNLKQSNTKFFDDIMNFDIDELKKIINNLTIQHTNKDYVIERKKLSLDLIEKLSKFSNITIGSHSMSHILLKDLPINWLEWEIKTSLDYIHKFNGNNNIFSLPYGNTNSYSNEVIKLLVDNKVNHIFTTTNLINKSNNILKGRSFILNSKNKFYLQGMINGGSYIFNKIFFKK